MSNVSDTNEIVAVHLLFPLHEHFLLGGRPHVTAGSIGERKLWRGRSTSICAGNAWSGPGTSRNDAYRQWRPRMERDICLGWPVDL